MAPSTTTGGREGGTFDLFRLGESILLDNDVDDDEYRWDVPVLPPHMMMKGERSKRMVLSTSKSIESVVHCHTYWLLPLSYLYCSWSSLGCLCSVVVAVVDRVCRDEDRKGARYGRYLDSHHGFGLETSAIRGRGGIKRGDTPIFLKMVPHSVTKLWKKLRYYFLIKNK